MVNPAVVAELCIYILTWNVGGQSPHNAFLNGALSLNGTNSCPDNKLPDIYVLGFQKVKTDPLSQMKSLFKKDEWTKKAESELSPRGYKKVKTEQMQGILVSVWAKKEHLSNISDVETESTKTGILNYLGNKGAVSVRMTLYGTGVTFIVAHLEGRDGNLAERVKDYKQIVEKHHYKQTGYQNISDHAAVFWLGDLNFRLIDSPLDILDEVNSNNLDILLPLDQLTIVRKSGEAFESMDEEQPTFKPTYKFSKGTHHYDPYYRPAWCDRVLYRVNETKYPNMELNLKQLSYKSHPTCLLSEHIPVTAEFLYTISTISDAPASES